MKKLLQLKKLSSLLLVVFTTMTVSVKAQGTAMPVVTTANAENVMFNAAKLNGTVNANGNTATMSFEYGTTTAYGTTVGATPITVSGNTTTPIQANITNLQSNTLYYFRTVATYNNGLVVHGNAKSFTTPFYTQAPPMAALAADIMHTSFVAKWTAASQATNYRIDVSLNENFSSFLTGYHDLVVNGTSIKVEGPEVIANTQFYYRVRAYNQVHNVSSVNSATIPVHTANPYMWNGTSWSRSGDPGIADEIYIMGNFNMATHNTGNSTPASLTCKSLRVINGTLTISEGMGIFVNDEINVGDDAEIIIENNASLIQRNDINNNKGRINVARKNMGLYRLDYSLWSAPVKNQNLLAFSPNTVINRFYKYDTAQNLYVSSNHIAFDPATENFGTGTGYLIRMPNSDATEGYNTGMASLEFNGQFKGEPNNGQIQVNLSTAGFGYNAIGNPYPSPIDAMVFLETYAEGSNPVIDGTLYFWRKRNALEGDFYATFTKAGGTAATGNAEGGPLLTNEPNGTIQVGQGFIVKALQGGEKTLFTNDVRLHDATSPFYRNSNAIERHRMWFNLSTPEGLTYNSLVAYMEGATNNEDAAIDGKRFNNANDGFYSVINNGQYAIQGRVLPFDVQDEVAMGYTANNAGNYTITLAKTDGLFLQEQPIYIKDNVTGTIHNVKEGAYTFVTEAGTFNDRFTIVYTEAPAMSVNDNTFTANNVVVYKQGNALTINTGKVNMTDVTIHDIQGRVVYNANNLKANETVINDIQSQHQVLIVQVNTPQGKVSKKIVF